MEQLLEFLGNHLFLSAAFVAATAVFAWTFVAGAGQGVHKVGPMDATRLINHEDAVVLDVRAEGEFREGHILNAVHIPQRELAAQIGKLKKYQDKPIIAACRSGQRSASACNVLRKHGFEKVYNLSGGILAWESANLPLTRK